MSHLTFAVPKVLSVKKPPKQLKRTAFKSKPTKLKKRRTKADWTNEDWRHEAVEWAKKIAKHLAGYVCCKCGNSAEMEKQQHGSHILPEGKFHRMSVIVENIMDQCARCHFDWHENPLAQKKWFEEKFPGKYEQLKAMDAEFKKDHIKPNYKQIHDDLKAEYDSLIN